MENNIPKITIYGTTIYIDVIKIELEEGPCLAYTFQDLINKNYIIALVCGDIFKLETIYSRIHSSCITSETFCSLDCDCSNQLREALKIIHKKKGILFYLLQEGRGSGYIGKSRACQMVQYSNDTITTFDAYKELGMKKDYRIYTNIKDIFNMFQINPSMILLTNNPDKINGLRDNGIIIKSIEAIEIKPNLFNIHYLISKKKSGHLLQKTDKTDQFLNTDIFKLPFPPIKPFLPYNIEKCKRFIYTSSYYLPIGYMDDLVLVNKEINNTNIFSINNNSISKSNLIKDNGELIKPIWFNVNVLYDIINQNEFVILKYIDKNINIGDTIPVIRIHSESIFNRFPLKEALYKQIYHRSLKHIFTRGYGYLIIFYQDGRGFGLGNYILNKATEDKLSNISEYNDNDKRDFSAVARLMKYFLKLNKIDLLYSCQTSLLTSERHIKENNIEINKIIYIGHSNEKLGQLSLQHRNLLNYSNLLTENNVVNSIHINSSSYVTGLGSSKSHAIYLKTILNHYLGYKLEYIPFNELLDTNFKHLVVFSQGLSPHITKLIEKFTNSNIILITSQNNELDSVKYQIKLTRDIEKQTLIRINGAFEGFKVSWKILEYLSNNRCYAKSLPQKLISIPYIKQLNFFNTLLHEIKLPIYSFFNNLIKHKKICLLCDNPMLTFMDNIKMKFIEGVFIDNIILVETREFVHGYYQLLETKRLNNEQYVVIVFDNGVCEDISDNLDKLLHKYPVWKISNNLPYYLKILDYELQMNIFILQLMEYLKINQVEWEGKSNQHLIYNN